MVCQIPTHTTTPTFRDDARRWRAPCPWVLRPIPFSFVRDRGLETHRRSAFCLPLGMYHPIGNVDANRGDREKPLFFARDNSRLYVYARAGHRGKVVSAPDIHRNTHYIYDFRGRRSKATSWSAVPLSVCLMARQVARAIFIIPRVRCVAQGATADANGV